MNADGRVPTLAPAALLRDDIVAGRRCHPARRVGARSSAFIRGQSAVAPVRWSAQPSQVLTASCGREHNAILRNHANLPIRPAPSMRNRIPALLALSVSVLALPALAQQREG